MGTQQVLLIVLGVIIVGVAVAVGITMFITQSASSNREALKADLMNYATQTLSWYKAPTSMAGGGKGNPGFGNHWNNVNCDIWKGFPKYCNEYSTSYRNDNGFFATRFYGNGAAAQIYCLGRAKGQNPNSLPWPWADAPESFRGNVLLTLFIYADQDPQYRIVVNN